MAYAYELYYEDYEGDAYENSWFGGWNYRTNENIAGIGNVLGRFDYTQQLEKDFYLNGNFGWLQIRFDFWEIDSWDNEYFKVFINGYEVNLGTFHTNANEGTRSGSTFDIDWSFTSGSLSNKGAGSWNDQLHSVTITVEETNILNAKNLNLRFEAGTNQGVDDESYAIDNLVVEVIDWGETRLHEDSFEHNVTQANYHSGWINEKFTSLTGYGNVLGLYGAGESVSKRIDVQDTARVVGISFDFLEMDSWNYEEFIVTINGVDVSLGTFAFNNDEGTRRGEVNGINWEMFSSFEQNIGGNSSYIDQEHYVAIYVPEMYLAQNRIDVEFSSTLNSGSSNESFAIDNFRVDSTEKKSVIAASDTFENGSDGWSIDKTDRNIDLGIGDNFLGRFDGTEDVEKTFELPGGTNGVRVEFDFLEIDSWNTENFFVYLNGVAVDLGTFNWSTDEGYRAGSTNGVNYILLPYNAPDDRGFWSYDDQAFRVRLATTTDIVGHDELTVKFDARTDSAVSNESYGIDNFIIKAELETNDFLNDGSALSTIRWETTDSGNDAALWDTNATMGTFMGRFNNTQDFSHGFTFNNYDLKEGARIEFDFLKIDSWDNEQFVVYVNGHEVNLGTFSGNTATQTSGFQNGIEWRISNSVHHGNAGYGGWADSTYTIQMDIRQNILSGHVLKMTYDARTNSGTSDESFGIDNVKLIGEVDKLITHSSTSVTPLAQEFSEGHINIGHELKVGDVLRQGEAIVSDDYGAAMFLRSNGVFGIIEDRDHDGDYELKYNVFGTADRFDQISINAATGALQGRIEGTSTYRSLTNTNGDHDGHRILAHANGVSTMEEDGSQITRIGADGSVRHLQQGNDLLINLEIDSFSNATYTPLSKTGTSDGWSYTTGPTDQSWDYGVRYDLNSLIMNGDGVVQGGGDYTKMLRIDQIDDNAPLNFEFVIYDEINYSANVKIYIGDMTNQWSNISTQDQHRYVFDVGALTAGSGNSAPAGTSITVEQIDAATKKYKVSLTIDDPTALPRTVSALPDQNLTDVVWQDLDYNPNIITNLMKVHIDMGQNNAVRGSLADFRVTQMQNRSEDTPLLSDHLSKFDLIELPSLTYNTSTGTLSNLINDINNGFETTVAGLKQLHRDYSFKDLNDFDFSLYSANDVNNYATTLRTTMTDMIGHISNNSNSGNLFEYSELMWKELKQESNLLDAERTADVLKFIGFGVALLAGGLTVYAGLSGLAATEAATEASVADVVDAELNENFSIEEEFAGQDDNPFELFTIDEDEELDYMDGPDDYSSDGSTGGEVNDPNVIENMDFVEEHYDTINGSRASWSSRIWEFMKDNKGTIGLAGTATIATSTYMGGVSKGVNDGGFLAYGADTPDMHETLNRAIDTFRASAENSGNSTYIAAADELDVILEAYGEATDEMSANLTAISFIHQFVIPYNTTGGSARQRHIEPDQDYILDMEEGFWVSLGFDVTRSVETRVVGTSRSEVTTFTVQDGYNDLAGIDGFEYEIWREMFISSTNLKPDAFNYASNFSVL